MKSETYTFEKGDVKLVFSFPINDKIKENKETFIILLQEALDALLKEIKS